MSRLGVFSIEGEWRPHQPGTRETVKSFLTVLEDLGDIEWFHRDAATRAEVNHLLDRWAGHGTDKLRSYNQYNVLYLSFHGEQGRIWIPAEHATLSLTQLATRLAGGCKGKIVHFGSCHVLDVDRARIAAFRKKTGARLVSGYSRNVNWVESAALDMLLLSYLADERTDARAVKRLRRRNPVLVEELGFVTEPAYD